MIDTAPAPAPLRGVDVNPRSDAYWIECDDCHAPGLVSRALVMGARRLCPSCHHNATVYVLSGAPLSGRYGIKGRLTVVFRKDWGAGSLT